MKRGWTASKRGFTLPAAMLYVAVITAAIAGVVSLVLAEHRIAKDAAARLQALYAAEAGVDLALNEFNRAVQGKTAWEGWTRDGRTYCQTTTPEVLRRGSTFQPSVRVVVDSSAMRILACGAAVSAARLTVLTERVVVTLKQRGPTCEIETWHKMAAHDH